MSGPFPATVNGAPATIETFINGVIVGFAAGASLGAAIDLGVSDRSPAHDPAVSLI